MPSSVALDTTAPVSWEAGTQKTEAPSRLFAITRALLVATLLAAPLPFGAVQEWAWGTLAVIVFLLLLVWSIDKVEKGVIRLEWTPLYLPAGLFFVLGMIQFFGHFTLDSITTRESLLKFATDLVIFFLALQFCGAPAEKATLCPPPQSSEAGNSALPPSHAPDMPVRGGAGSPVRALGWTIVAYSFILSLFAIFQFFSSHGLIYWTIATHGWTFGPYVNHNDYAGLMELLIPIMVATVLTVFRRRPTPSTSKAVSADAWSGARSLPSRLAGPAYWQPSASRTAREPSTTALAIFLGCVVLIPIVSVLLSGSRGGLISLAFEALLAAVLIFLRGPSSARRITVVLGSSALLAAALLFVWIAPRQSLERLATLVDAAHSPEVGLAERLVVSRDSLGILRDHPWLGSGLGSFETVFHRYQSFPTDLTWDHAHNDYVEALAETGLAGGALILLALGLFFWLAFRNLGERLRHRAGWIRFGAAIGCCGLLVHSFADFNLHIPANAAWVALCLALATSQPRAVESGGAQLRRFPATTQVVS
jgi:hypothetical protein